MFKIFFSRSLCFWYLFTKIFLFCIFYDFFQLPSTQFFFLVLSYRVTYRKLPTPNILPPINNVKNRETYIFVCSWSNILPGFLFVSKIFDSPVCFCYIFTKIFPSIFFSQNFSSCYTYSYLSWCNFVWKSAKFLFRSF